MNREKFMDQDPDPYTVCPERVDPVNIRPDPRPCSHNRKKNKICMVVYNINSAKHISSNLNLHYFPFFASSLTPINS